MGSLPGLDIEHPIIQAPMAGVSTPELAAAVSNAGGLGSLGLGAASVPQARDAIEQTQALTDRPFQVNLFCHQPARRDVEREAEWIRHLAPLFAEVGAPVPEQASEIYSSFVARQDMLDMLLEVRPAVVSFHFGLPLDWQLSALREAGITTMASATNLEEARLVEQAGIDIVVAQGLEAGGHRGVFDPEAADEGMSTFVLTRLLVRETTLPVVAAGGIMDGRGIRAVLELGAAAAQLGTAFILCPESAAGQGYRDMLKSERAKQTRLTASFSGRPARGMMNRFISHAEAKGSPGPAAYPVAYDVAKQLNAAAAGRDIHEFAAHWAGQGAPLAREMGAAQLVELLLDELK